MGRTIIGHNPLLCAADGKHWQTVRLLLDYGANPNYQTRHYQNSTLILAAAFGNKDLVKILLRHGADVSAEDMYGETPLWFARHNKYTAIVRILRRAGAKR